jgi:hypothetical protein
MFQIPDLSFTLNSERQTIKHDQKIGNTVEP